MSSVMGTLVGIHPTTFEHLDSIARFGGWYWQRETTAGLARLIPVKEGIPYVADFIFVPIADVRSYTANIGSVLPIQKGQDSGKTNSS